MKSLQYQLNTIGDFSVTREPATAVWWLPPGLAIDTLRTFKDSFAKRRGIVVVRTFNEGQEAGKKTVQHVLTPRDGKPLGIAVIWDDVPTRDGELVTAFVMATTPPSPLVATITDRMPAILPPDHWSIWLCETATPLEKVKAILVPFAGELDMKLQPKAPPKPRGGGNATVPPMI